MKVKIKNYEYEIIEIENDEDFFENGQLKLYGDTNSITQKIRIYKHLTHSRKKETVIHELTHAFHDTYLASFHIKDKFDEEDVCCFLASYGEEIINIANKYFEKSDSI